MCEEYATLNTNPIEANLRLYGRETHQRGRRSDYGPVVQNRKFFVYRRCEIQTKLCRYINFGIFLRRNQLLIPSPTIWLLFHMCG